MPAFRPLSGPAPTGTAYRPRPWAWCFLLLAALLLTWSARAGWAQTGGGGGCPDASVYIEEP